MMKVTEYTKDKGVCLLSENVVAFNSWHSFQSPFILFPQSTDLFVNFWFLSRLYCDLVLITFHFKEICISL